MCITARTDQYFNIFIISIQVYECKALFIQSSDDGRGIFSFMDILIIIIIAVKFRCFMFLVLLSVYVFVGIWVRIHLFSYT